jgi:hypothetical protein
MALTVKDLIEKLRAFPEDTEVLSKTIGDEKIILYAKDHHLDPICQLSIPLLGLCPMTYASDEVEKNAAQ